MSTVPPKFALDDFIARAVSGTPPELHPFFEKFRDLYTKKLWHQLTLQLFAFLENPLSKPYRVNVFEQFVRDFEARINQLRLVELGVKVSKEIDNPQNHILFLQSLHKRLAVDANLDGPESSTSALPLPANKEAHILLLSTISRAKLIFGDLESAKVDMDEAYKVLDDLEGVESSVRAAYYDVAAQYHKGKGHYAQYYKNSLLYLACVDLAKDMSSEERLSQAHDLGIAAFLADTIYNFGELLTHPILSALDSTPHEWIKKLLFAFNEGSIGKFEALAPLLTQEPVLQRSYPFLREKICLMTLIDLVFRRRGVDGKGNWNRTLTFAEIAQEIRLPEDEVEHLLMKAMSLSLIKGSLDQPAGVATITWVQPRVLSIQQIEDMAKSLEGWIKRIGEVDRRVTELQ